MTGAQWAILVPALVSLAGAAAAYLKAHSAATNAQHARTKASAALDLVSNHVTANTITGGTTDATRPAGSGLESPGAAGTPGTVPPSPAP